MKIEIEVTEGEIKSAIERKVRVAIADQTTQWGVTQHIEQEVKKAIPAAISALITECLADHDGLRAKIIDRIEKSLTAKVQAALKLKS